MKFTRKHRHGPFEDTNRKRLALARKHRLEREKLPLFAEITAESQPDADTVMAERAVKFDNWQQRFRDDRAANWRKARSRLFSYGDNIRPTLRRLWNASPYPKDPVYLLDMLHSYAVGRLDVDNPPWGYRGTGLKTFDMTAILERAKARREAQDARHVRKMHDPEPFILEVCR